ncbi:hypothetical protein RHGRI_026019 [Rhododendron griersonianum]|uniref:Telomerase reverse transcriptase n=1 Tax=Rhododendron griersonianum TaxID=479676 RepID=A0AAV6IUT8_9ERIC|nr:hypothetical protein RHGRI_026019 [Rhododendron griersonianum]
MARKRRPRLPEVLWKIFNSRARTLAHTIISLVPPPTPSAAAGRCKGRGRQDPSDCGKPSTQCFLDVSDNSPPLSAFYQDRRWSQREEAKGCGGSMEVVQQPRSNPLISPSRHCGGVILQGVRMGVVAATEQRLSSSGERTCPTMCFCADSNHIHLAALLFELCHEAFHKFSMGLCIESLRRVVFNNTWKGLGVLIKSLSRMTLFARNATKEPTPSIDNDTWLRTGPDGLRIYLAFRIITQLKMRLNHYDNSEMNCVKSFKAFRLPNACR